MGLIHEAVRFLLRTVAVPDPNLQQRLLQMVDADEAGFDSIEAHQEAQAAAQPAEPTPAPEPAPEEPVNPTPVPDAPVAAEAPAEPVPGVVEQAEPGDAI